MTTVFLINFKYLNNTLPKEILDTRVGGMAQVGKHLPSKQKDLSPNSSTTKKKKKKKKKQEKKF
jgi:hypothetical protein